MQSGALATVHTKGCNHMMTEPHQESKQCAATGHVYSSTLAVRCRHRESYTVTTRVWLDTGDDETQEIWSAHYELGPFDSIDELTEIAAQQAADAALLVAAYHP